VKSGNFKAPPIVLQALILGYIRCVSPKCRPCRGFLVFIGVVSHGFPFPSLRASAVGYVVASLRDSR
jgi:hypothetical protein